MFNNQTRQQLNIRKHANYIHLIQQKKHHVILTNVQVIILIRMKPGKFGKPSEDGGIGCLTTKCKV